VLGTKRAGNVCELKQGEKNIHPLGDRELDLRSGTLRRVGNYNALWKPETLSLGPEVF